MLLDWNYIDLCTYKHYLDSWNALFDQATEVLLPSWNQSVYLILILCYMSIVALNKKCLYIVTFSLFFSFHSSVHSAINISINNFHIICCHLLFWHVIQSLTMCVTMLYMFVCGMSVNMDWVILAYLCVDILGYLDIHGSMSYFGHFNFDSI